MDRSLVAIMKVQDDSLCWGLKPGNDESLQSIQVLVDPLMRRAHSSPVTAIKATTMHNSK